MAAVFFPIACALSQTTFWNNKEPEGYSDEERTQILTSSPWAKVVHSKTPGIETVGPSGPSGQGDNSYHPPRHPSASPSSRIPKQNVKDPLAFYGSVTIRWESAYPIRQVTRIPVPDIFQNHYVISVTGLPSSVLTQGGDNNRALLPNATLSEGKHQPKPAEFVALTGDKLTLLFAFPVSEPSIGATRKAIVFTMNLNGIRLMAKFEPKEMICRGLLAL